MTEDSKRSLVSLHRHLHAQVIERLLEFYSALTSLDLAVARSRWATYEAALDAHATAEERVIFPACEGLDLPVKASVDILERDHDLIRSSSEKIGGLLDALDALPEAQRRQHLVRGMDPLVRLHRVLEHHGLRENDLLYPLAQERLSETERAPLYAALLNTAPLTERQGS